MKEKIIQQGAEAKIILNGNTIIKKRIPKKYRIKELDDKIRRQRTRSEFKILEKVSKIISIPSNIDVNENEFEIYMEFLDGKRLSHHLNDLDEKEQLDIMKQIGKSVSKIHDANIIHGDLTTSNMIYKNNIVYFIDFGLGFQNGKYEDKAVDIHLLRQALEAKHYKNWEKLFDIFLKGYKKSKNYERVIDRFKIVEKRGRYKDKY
jgi:TP53 regulating kinase-like protein